MCIRRVAGSSAVIVLLFASTLNAAVSEVADAVMKGSNEAVRSLLARKADVNAPQEEDLESARLLMASGADVNAIVDGITGGLAVKEQEKK